MSIGTDFIQSSVKRFRSYKELGDKTFAQLEEQDFHFRPNEANNSIAIIIQHMAGNMLSRVFAINQSLQIHNCLKFMRSAQGSHRK